MWPFWSMSDHGARIDREKVWSGRRSGVRRHRGNFVTSDTASVKWSAIIAACPGKSAPHNAALTPP